MICDICKKDVKYLTGDWNLPTKERKWLCTKCIRPKKTKDKSKR